MSPSELNEAIARSTGEPVSLIRSLGFCIADPALVNYDPEPRRPLILDWDSMSTADWPD